MLEVAVKMGWRRDAYMVIVEEQHDEKAEGNRDGNPFPFEVPKINDPASRLCWVEGSGDGDSLNVRVLDGPWDMREADPKDGAELVLAMNSNGKEATWSMCSYNIGIIGQQGLGSRHIAIIALR
jgi:hypothetical protein